MIMTTDCWVLNLLHTFQAGVVLLLKRFEYSCAANDPGLFSELGFCEDCSLRADAYLFKYDDIANKTDEETICHFFLTQLIITPTFLNRLPFLNVFVEMAHLLQK